MSQKIPEVFDKLKTKISEQDLTNAKRTLSRLTVMLRLLTSVKDYAQHGIPELKVGGREIFDWLFAKEFATALVDKGSSIMSDVRSLLEKISR